MGGDGREQTVGPDGLVNTDVPPTPGPTVPPRVTGRDAAFDLLRSIALVRIIFWHLFAQTWMTWFAAIPVLFFVAGAVLPRSGDHVAFLTRRLRRILLPLWVYTAGVAIASVRFGHLPGASPGSLGRALTWLVPVVDPTPTGWDAGWLSNHLWYLRAYLWILLLTPILIRLSKRVGHAALGTALAVVGLEVAARSGIAVVGSGTVRVVLGDALVYGFFAVVGIRYRANARTSNARTSNARTSKPPVLAGAAVLFGLAAVAFARTSGLPSEGVNGSYPAILLVGCAWLSALGAIEHHLRTFSAHPRVQRATRVVSSRSLTVYLWHPACIVVARRFVPVEGVAGTITVVVATFALIRVAVGLVGWVENVASGRPVSSPRLTPRGAFGGALATSLIVAATVPVVAGRVPVMASAGRTPIVVGIPAPSAREALSDSDFASSRTPTPPSPTPPSVPVPSLLAFRSGSADEAPGIETRQVPATTPMPTATLRNAVVPPSGLIALRSGSTAAAKPKVTATATATATAKKTRARPALRCRHAWLPNAQLQRRLVLLPPPQPLRATQTREDLLQTTKRGMVLQSARQAMTTNPLASARLSSLEAPAHRQRQSPVAR